MGKQSLIQPARIPTQELAGGEITWPANRRPDVDENEVHVATRLGCGSGGHVYAGVYQGRDVAVKFLLEEHDMQSVKDFIQVHIINDSSYCHVCTQRSIYAYVEAMRSMRS